MNKIKKVMITLFLISLISILLCAFTGNYQIAEIIVGTWALIGLISMIIAFVFNLTIERKKAVGLK